MQLCTSKHTSSIILSVPACIHSLASCSESKVVVVTGKSPRQANPKRRECSKWAKPAISDTGPTMNTSWMLCIVHTTPYRAAIICNCSPRQIRLVPSIIDRCKLQSRKVTSGRRTPLHTGITIARTLITNDGRSMGCVTHMLLTCEIEKCS